MITIGVIVLKTLQLHPLRLVGGGAVRKGLHRAPWSLGTASPIYPLLHLQFHQGALVHVGDELKAVQERQHLVINGEDLPLEVVALSGNVQEERNVAFASDDQRELVNGAGSATEGSLPVDRVQHPGVVGLSPLQGPINKDLSHLDCWQHKGH